jgi:hypothetical protein
MVGASKFDDSLATKDAYDLSTGSCYPCSLIVGTWYTRSHQIWTVSGDNDVGDHAIGDTGIPLAEASCCPFNRVKPIRPIQQRCQPCYGTCAPDGRWCNECWIRASDGKLARTAAA